MAKIIKLIIFFLITNGEIKDILLDFNEKNIIPKQSKQNNSPKISIFLPIYNKEKFLQRSIGSLQRQTLKEIEIIPVNDGSTDDSLVILKGMAKKDPRITIVKILSFYS